MNDISIAHFLQYQFEVSIDCTVPHLWSLLTDDINAWWLDDFRALGSGSTLTLTAESGGHLVERAHDSSSLEWYRVQMVLPQKALHLVGYIAPDWGGPTTTMLKLAIEPRDLGCVLIVSDALLGSVSESSAKNAEMGWRELFVNGLKRLAEN